jgi:glycosyltransferase involved in cell wall biosynthesis
MNVWAAAEIDLAQPGGPLEHLSGFLNAANRIGWKTVLSVPQASAAPARNFNADLDFFPGSGAMRQLHFQRHLWQEWRRRLSSGQRPDCIFVREGQWLLAPALLARHKRIPYFFEVNGIITRQLFMRNLPAPLIRASDAIERTACSHADGVIAISPSVAEELIRRHGVDEQRMHAIPSGIDCEEFRPPYDEAERAADRASFGLGQGLVIGYVGTFDWWQGLPNLLRAFASIKRSGEGECVLAGYGTGEGTLRDLVGRLGIGNCVRFPGRIAPADVPRFMRAIDVGVLPRDDYAPTPTKLLQYFACGLASVYPALPDLVWLGEAGCTYAAGVAAESPEGLAGALLKMKTMDARHYYGRRSRELCLRTLDWSVIAARVDTLARRAVELRKDGMRG